MNDLRILTFALTCVLAIQSGNSCFAVDTTWNIDGDGSWDTAANWTDGAPALSDTAIIDNTVTPGNAVTVTVPGSVTRDVSAVTIVANGLDPHELVVSNNTFLDVRGGSVENNGIVRLESTGNNTLMRADGMDVELTGTGNLVLTEAGGLSAIGNFGFVNGGSHTISGFGNLGLNSAAFTNNSLIDANVLDEVLLIDPRNLGVGAAGFQNNATVRASGGGILALTGSGAGEFGGAGTYEAQHDSEIRIGSSTLVRNATFSTSGTGFVRTNDSSNTEFYDVTLNGDFRVGNNADARMHGTITNTGSITLDSVANQSDFELGANVTLTGGGVLTMTGGAAQINSVSNFRLTNVNNTIQGNGDIGGNSAAITNNALIDANVPDEVLLLDPRNLGVGVAAFQNNATVRASGGGILELTGSGAGEFGGTGTYEAQNDSEVRIASGAVIRNATFSTSGTGFVRTNDGTNTEFYDATLNGDFRVGNNADARMHGTITNTGSITLDSVANQSDFELGANVTLTGGGVLTMTGGAAQINSVSNFRLTNVNNTIQGNGDIGGNSAAITNNALIDANVPDEVLLLDPRNLGVGVAAFQNNATVRASGGGILELTGSGAGEFGGTGTYEAQNDSEVRIASGAVIRNATFSTSGTGFVRTNDGTNTEFYDVTLNGDFRVGNNADARMHGTITNTGSIALDSLGNQSDFELGTDVTLTGGGVLTMSGSVAQINSVGNFRLTNVNNTIQGRGNLGGNSATITNEALIVANVSGQTLTLDPRNNGADSFANSGTLRAAGGGQLVLSGSGAGGFSNTGTIEALDGSSVTAVSNPTIAQIAGASVTAGTYRAIDSGNGATLNIAPVGFEVAVNDGVIEASGAAASNDVLGLFSGGVHTNSALVTNNGSILLDEGASLELTGSGLHLVSTGELLVGNASSLDATARSTTFPVVGDTTDAGVQIDGGTLRGSGTILGGVYMPSGTLLPGDADGEAGLLSITGDFNMDDPGLLIEDAFTVIELGGYARGTEHDSFAATGDFFGQGVLQARLIDGFLPVVGDEFVLATYVEDGNRIGNLWDNYQFNRVQFSLDDRSTGGQNRETILTVLDFRDIDFDGDSDFDCADIDALVTAIVQGSTATQFDLNFDGTVDNDDLGIWLTDAGTLNLASGQGYLPGDANLNGVVDGEDFLVWNTNKFSPGSGWCSGDFNADGSVNGADFLIWNSFKFQSSGIATLQAGTIPSTLAAVPEPVGNFSLAVAMMFMGLGWRQAARNSRQLRSGASR